MGAYRDSFKNSGVFSEEFKDPSEDTGGGVAGGEDNSGDIVGNLVVEDFGQDFRQLRSCFHGFVEERSRKIYRHGVVAFLENVVAPLQIFPVDNLVLSQYGKQRHIESVDESSLQGMEGVGGDGFDGGDEVFDGFRHECSEDKLPEFGMVVSLVEEDGLFPQHSLFARRKSWLEEMSLGHQNHLRRRRAGDHHTPTPQNVGLEYRTIPTKNHSPITIKKSNKEN
nr:hypothetical protein Iba_chr15dCG2200 [Ipomoea batatas]